MNGTRRTTSVASILMLAVAGAISMAASVEAGAAAPLRLHEDMTLAGDHDGWISIEADGVTLDCDGHSIIGSGPDFTPHGVFVGHRTGVTVRNCVISDVNQGIGLVGTSDSVIEGNTIRDVRQGMVLSAGSVGNSILSNRVDNAFNYFGMLIIGGSDANSVVGNRVERTPVAYLVVGTDGHTFEANVAELEPWM